MSGLITLIITFAIIIKVIDVFITQAKKSNRQKTKTALNVDGNIVASIAGIIVLIWLIEIARKADVNLLHALIIIATLAIVITITLHMILNKNDKLPDSKHIEFINEVKDYYQKQEFKKRQEITNSEYLTPWNVLEKSEQNEHSEIVWDKAFLSTLDWKLFEDICAEYLRLNNYKAETTSLGKDYGIDIKIKNDTGKVIIIGQCKAIRNQVNVKDVREFYGVMASEKIINGIYMTTSTFTENAKEFVNNKKMILIDGDNFIELFNKLDYYSKKKLNNMTKTNDYDIPSCARCGTKMVIRTNSNDGSPFWGCSNYPRCHRTLYIKKSYFRG